MKIVPTAGSDVESTLCDVDRMAEVLRDLLFQLGEHTQAGAVPKKFMEELEHAVFIGSTLREMVGALKVEYYADFEGRMSTDRSQESRRMSN